MLSKEGLGGNSWLYRHVYPIPAHLRERSAKIENCTSLVFGWKIKNWNASSSQFKAFEILCRVTAVLQVHLAHLSTSRTQLEVSNETFLGSDDIFAQDN